MRIAIDCRKIADYGIGTYIRGLLSGLARLDGDEEYFVIAPRRHHALVPAPEKFRLIDDDSPHYSARELFAVARHLERHAIDLCHAPHYVVPLTKRPIVVTIHDLIHLKTRHANPLKPVYARWMMTRAARESARILTVSDTVRLEIENRFPGSGSKIDVTPNGVGEEWFVAPERDEIERVIARHGLGSGRYVLFVGNDKPHKNLNRLAAAVGRSSRGLKLAVAGTPRRELAERESVVTTGHVPLEELRCLYRGALAVALVSSDEGFGLPVVEAMACGTPVIISDIAALRETAGEAALRADPESVESIALAIDRIASDRDLRDSLSALGRERARHYSWLRCAELTRGAYRNALDDRNIPNDR